MQWAAPELRGDANVETGAQVGVAPRRCVQPLCPWTLGAGRLPPRVSPPPALEHAQQLRPRSPEVRERRRVRTCKCTGREAAPRTRANPRAGPRCQISSQLAAPGTRASLQQPWAASHSLGTVTSERHPGAGTVLPPCTRHPGFHSYDYHIQAGHT